MEKFTKRLVIAVLVFLFAYKIIQFIEYVDPKKISIATWNVQTFFDVDFSGTEYSEFNNPKTDWSKEKYYVRLLRMAEALTKINVDVVALEEIENINVVYDIVDVLPYTSKFHYAVFAKQQGSPFGLALFSRYPISKARTHQIQPMQNISVESVSFRPILEVHLKVPKNDVVIFVNHWKSKASDAELSKIFRQSQQRMLADCIFYTKEETKSENLVIAAIGDFNQKTEEFEIDKTTSEIVFSGTHSVEYMKSSWLEKSNESVGSYYFADNWEQIDHIFLWSKSAHLKNAEQ